MKSKKFREKGLSFGAPQNQTEFSWHGRGFFAKIGKKIAKIILLRKQSAEENEKNVYNQIHRGKSLLPDADFV